MTVSRSCTASSASNREGFVHSNPRDRFQATMELVSLEETDANGLPTAMPEVAWSRCPAMASSSTRAALLVESGVKINHGPVLLGHFLGHGSLPEPLAELAEVVGPHPVHSPLAFAQLDGLPQVRLPPRMCRDGLIDGM